MGVTETENLLSDLAFKSFLSLWSYPNVYRDQRADKIGDGKELVDLMVIFENNVLLFSDKKCEAVDSADEKVGWMRWYKRAVLKSAGQIDGASRWIDHFSDRIFVDKACNCRLPIEFPSNDVKIYKIIVANGYHENRSISLRNNLIDDFEDNISMFNCRKSNGEFYHIFNEISIRMVLKSFDTTRDFLKYLYYRQEYLSKLEMCEIVSGENIIINSFSRNEDQLRELMKYFSYEEIINDNYMRSLIEYSYEIDKIIEHFTEYIGQYIFPYDIDQTHLGVEKGLRIMAALTRAERMYISKHSQGFFAKPIEADFDVRTIISPDFDLPTIVWLKSLYLTLRATS